MRDARLVLVLAFAIALAGCAWMQSAQRAVTGGSGDISGETYYAAADGLPVRADASASAKVVGRLGLHEKVTRTQVDRGYAHVVAGSGVEGWVDNAQLLWRLPAAAAAPPAPAPTETEAVKTEPEPAPATQPAPAPRPAAPPQPPADPSKPNPTVFDPF
jgi:hypothetical protein